MSTRDGHKWLVVYLPEGPFVARRDSPAGLQALRQSDPVSKYRTLRVAYARLRSTRPYR